MGYATASIRILGQDLNPSEVSELLGCEPTSHSKKGEPVKLKHRTVERLATSGRWSLDVEDKNLDIDQQINFLLSKLTSDLDVWKLLTQKYRVDIFCGYFMTDELDGYSLEVSTMSALVQRNISFGVCLYLPD